MLLGWLSIIGSGGMKSSPTANAHAPLSFMGTALISPTATATATPTSNGGGLDATIIAALIALVGVLLAAIIAGVFGIIQMQRGARLQRDQALEIARLQQELQEQSQAKERERQFSETDAANARATMKQAKNRDERVQAYRDALRTDPRIASLQILNMPQPLDMANVYVRLRVDKETRPSYRLDPDLLATGGSGPSDPNILMQADRMRLESRAGSALDPDEAIRRYKHCVIVGDPGAGKTTLLKYLALRSVEGQLKGLPNLPIHIELSAFTRSNEQSLLGFASTLWDKYYGFPQGEALTYMKESLDTGNALLLLDALDETVGCETDDAFENSYQRVIDAIAEVATRYHRSPIVVTARKAGYQRKNPLKGFIGLEVLDFRPEDIRKFVDGWFAQIPTPENQGESAADLNALLERNVRLQSLAANPLLLSLIVIVYQEHLDLPERRAELYNQCIETLQAKWDASRHIRRHHNFKSEHQRQLLEEVAWHFHQQRQRYFPTSELLAEIKRFLPVVGLPSDQNEQILDEITDENGLLKQQAQGWHGFLHLTLQEYFVALQANDQNQLAILLSHRCDPWWQEVILLYAGRTPDASGLLKGLIGETGNPPLREDIFHSNLILAGRCLAAYPTVRQADLWEKVINRLFDTLMHMPYSLTRLQIASALAEIGWAQPSVSTRLLSLLSNSTTSSDAGWCIADAIGAMGESSLAPGLLPLLSNSSIDEKVRWRITDALAKLGKRSTAFDLIPLLSNPQIPPFVCRSVADALGTIGERSVAPKLLPLLSDPQIDTLVRCSIAKALGTLGEKSIAPKLLLLLSDPQIDPNVHASVVAALGELGEQSMFAEMQHLLSDTGINPGVRMNIVDAMSKIGDASLMPPLEKLLLDPQIDPNLLIHITQVLSNLDEQTAVSSLQQLRSRALVDQKTPWSITEALGRLGDDSVIPDLLQLLHQSSHEVFSMTAETLASLGDRSIVPELLELLADPQIDKEGRWSIASALGQLIDDEANIRTLIDFLQDPEIASPVLRALWTACRRVGVRIFKMDGLTGHQVEIEKWGAGAESMSSFLI